MRLPDTSSVGRPGLEQSPEQRPKTRHNSAMNALAHRLIKLTAQPAGTPDTDHPKPERLVRGNPLRETWNRVDGGVGAGE
eukprot:gene19339-38635_t